MQTTDIQTSHNIVISFPLANLMQRILATIIDIIVICLYWFLISAMFMSLQTIAYILIIPVVSFYHLLFEVFNKGQSPGKKIMKLRVIDVHGRTPNIESYFMRWIFRLVDITFSVGTLAMIFIISSEQKQRLGDMLAQTMVVSLDKNSFISLESIEKLKIDHKEILYPRIVEYTDTDMLLVKQSINRHTAHPTDASRALLKDLTKRISEKLELESTGMADLKFLKKVLYEYIVLTR